VEQLDLLVGLGLCLAGCDVFGEEDLHGFSEEAGAGVVADEAGPAAGAEARLFDKFALRGGERSFSGFDAAGGKLEEELTGGVAVLALDQDGGICGVGGGIDGKDNNGAVVADNVAGAGDAARLGNSVFGNRKYVTFVDNFGREHDSLGAGWFGSGELGRGPAYR
jgi:hypothetical protein